MKQNQTTAAELDVEMAVSARYSAAAKMAEAALCCSVRYDQKYLEVLPQELIERDYGCGDPSRFVRAGESVLDLGSGGGKVCYIASQIVGPEGRVFGVDMNDEMLALARKHCKSIGDRIGWHNVEFHKGRIQDLALDLDAFEQYLAARPIASAADWLSAHREADLLRLQSPMISTNSIDIVLSNCVLNLVRPEDREQLFREVFRVLRPGGRAVISDIVSSVPVPTHMRTDPELWSGCISGAFEETAFLEAFESAGFVGLKIVERQASPWTRIEGVEFRSLTVQAFKPLARIDAGDGSEVIYRGPWKVVRDEVGNEFRRGQRTLVSLECLARLRNESFFDQVIVTTVGGSLNPSAELPTLTDRDRDCCGPGKHC